MVCVGPVPERVKSAGFDPPAKLKKGLANVAVDPPTFVTVNCCAVLDVPTGWLPKLNAAGVMVNEAAAGATPVPLSVVVPFTLPLTVKVLVCGPTLTGAKVMVNVQLCVGVRI